ncbi:hypothetical protein [Arenimonas sp. MALMAid1274]|uniref:hypothetical protein n=1 Tax=Arenimonas sp. MALMAid1274 TaxID=3411630 RepID=UPI003B9FF42D
MFVVAGVLAMPLARAEPDADEVLIAPSAFHGNWRVVARDDRGESALMQIALQHGAGQPEGHGDYTLFQPFCDAVAGQPITGMSDCELIGASDRFDQVVPRRRWLVLVFRPTADGQPHTLAVRRDGDRLVGQYRNPDLTLPIVLHRTD